MTTSRPSVRAAACNLAHLQHGIGIADIGHDRQPAKTGDNLAQKFKPLASKIGVPGPTVR